MPAPARSRPPPMHIELVDTLRCPSPHEETWLVAAVTRFDGRDIAEGALGCPICRREFPVRFGEVDFVTASSGLAAPSPDALAGTPHGAPAPAAPGDDRIDDRIDDIDAHGDVDDADSVHDAPPSGGADLLLRARALLGLDEGGGIVLVGGALARHAEALADAVAVMTLLLNPPAAAARASRPPSAVRAAGGVPLAPGSLRAAWLDGATATPPFLDAVVRALRPGGRLVAPAGATVPAGVRELVRDAQEWVGERDAMTPAPSAPVALRRRGAP